MKKLLLLLAILCIAGVCAPENTCQAQAITNITKLVLPNPPIPTPGKSLAINVQFPNKPGERIVNVTLLITSVTEAQPQDDGKKIKVLPPLPPPAHPQKRERGGAVVEGPKWDLRAGPMDTAGPFKTESPGLAISVQKKF